ncbi:clan AA aspartic protease [Sulfurisphaera javensis]|uniref:Clan AA aspartic protease n=1 Tax=Sulfurisphaera javensis TaxID=2049879 RepID=A0AAT9GVK3_9CREN
MTNITLLIENRDVNFKIDTGFDGECTLSFDIFNSIPGEELGDFVVRTATGEVVYMKSKKVRAEYKGKQIYLLCLSNCIINKNLLGERALSLLKLVIDYKNNKVDDP